MRGFVLQPTYRVTDGAAAVHLYGVLENGESFCVVDDRVRPYFFVPATHTDAARALGATVTSTDLRSFDGAPVARVEVQVPSDVPPLRQRLAGKQIDTFEADLRFAYRYLIDKGLRTAIRIDGAATPHGRIAHRFYNPTLAPAKFTPRLKTLSIDIETDPRAQRLFSIALAGPEERRVLIVGPGPLARAECLPTEGDVLRRFFALLEEIDPDVITGWNVVGFDLTVLQRLCRHHGIPFRLGRTEETTLQQDRSFTRDPRAQAPGRQVLDGLALCRSAFLKLDDYKLETAAQTLLGTGKLMAGDGRGSQIEDAFHHDRQRLVDYNLRDAELVLEILAKEHLVELAVSRSRLTGMQLDRVGASIATVDTLYLGLLRARGRVAPSVSAIRDDGRVAGGAVLDSVPGLFRNVLVFDFKSLYPSIIRTFNIDPLTYRPNDTAEDDAIRTPNGTRFSREPGILPLLVAELWQARDEARRTGETLHAYATKILMNSLYGVLAAPTCRLFSPAVANAITLTGQYLIHQAAAEVRRQGYQVLYGDTDSLFVAAHGDTAERAAQEAQAILATTSTALRRRLRDEFAVESHLELEFEKCYQRFFMPEVRRRTGGSKKRYAGMVDDQLEIVGLEAVRRDWTALAKRFQRELLTRIFHDQSCEELIRTTIADLRAGRLDEELIYRKAVRKSLAAYTRTTPAHVKAARKRTDGAGGIIAYVMTTAGPEPADAPTAPLDYEHYVTKQIEPIADAVLSLLGSRFGDVIGRARQLDLF